MHLDELDQILDSKVEQPDVNHVNSNFTLKGGRWRLLILFVLAPLCEPHAGAAPQAIDKTRLLGGFLCFRLRYRPIWGRLLLRYLFEGGVERLFRFVAT